MVESIGICEKHELPLDQNGECELCRLSDMPSKAPPAGSVWWAVAIPVLVLLAGAMWAYSSIGSDREAAPPRGVQPVAAPTDRSETSTSEPEAPKPERIPPRSTPPRPEDIPTPDDFAD
jgi:hypothetical protein